MAELRVDPRWMPGGAVKVDCQVEALGAITRVRVAPSIRYPGGASQYPAFPVSIVDERIVFFVSYPKSELAGKDAASILLFPFAFPGGVHPRGVHADARGMTLARP